MKYLSIITMASLLGIVVIGSCSFQKSTRDYDYEAYCDSIWDANPDYYLDCLVETDEYQEYIEVNGKWFD